MTAVHDPSWDLAQPLHAADVVGDVRLGELVEQDAALVHAVAGKERSRRLLPQPELARRVARQVQDLVAPVTEIDFVALVQHPGWGHGPHRVGRELITGTRQRGEQRSGWVVPRQLFGRIVVDHERGEPLRVRDRLGVVAVHEDLVELVQPTGVVEVPMRCEGDRRPIEQVGQLPAQRPDPQAGVDEEVALLSSDQEQVRLQKGVDVRLADTQDAVVNRLVLEPSLDHTHARDASGLTRRSPPG